ncbi:MAG: molybdopterin-dependent oxidoreductase, partial [Bacteroidota bacterium]
MSTTPQLHYRVCNLCEAMCGLEIQHIGSEVLSIKGDKNDPFSQGHICPKAMGLKDIFEDPNRLKRPVKKVGEDWEEISWEEAYETVASRIKEIQAQYGPASIGIYAGNPNVHNVGSILNLPLLIKAIKTPNLFSATSADQLPHHFAALEMFGHYMALPIPDIDRTDYMLILGGNPLASNGSIMTVPNVAKRLRAIQERGGQVIVLDPRKTETADKATAHHFVRPGTDVYVLLGMIHTLFQEKLVSTGHLQPYLEGLAEIEQLVAAYSPEAVSQTCGMEAETIRQLARELAGAERGLIYGRMGVSTQAFGGACNWLLNVLTILPDNLDKAGGMMFTSPAMDYVANGSRGKRGRWKSRVRGLEEFRGELPVSAMLE